MTEDEMNPDICPSALEENGTLNRSNGDEWGKHKWYESGTCEGEDARPEYTCAECGALKDCDNTIISRSF